MGRRKTQDIVIERFSRDVSRRFRISKAILFGSRARGDALTASDYDILLVSPDFEGVHFTERASGVLRSLTAHFPLDLLCYTPKEFEEKRKQIGIVRVAVREGKEFTVSG